MILGYAQVSTDLQNRDSQLNALMGAHCERIWTDHVTDLDRPQLADMLDHASSGDTIVVWRLDRLSRLVRDLVDFMQLFNSRGIEFRSLKEGLDTSTSEGRLLCNVIIALTQLEPTGVEVQEPGEEG